MKVTKHPLMLSGPGAAGGSGGVGGFSLPVDETVIRRLEVSMAVLSPPAKADAFARAFYEKLFALHPALRSMFKNDMAAQRKKLFDALAFVISHLRQPETVRTHLVEMGKRHVGYGAKPEHYPIVCRVMVEAMAETGGAEWNATLTNEWSQALGLVAEVMLSGAKEAT